jgi:hypothetical protein
MVRRWEVGQMEAQCLGSRRIADIEVLNIELKAWHKHRNQLQKGVDWQFVTTDARLKLKRLYPIII